MRFSLALRNVHDPAFMRSVKKAFSKYQQSMDRSPRRAVSREAFVDVDEKGAAWYLGHMASASIELEKKVQQADFVLEMRDARLPFTTENPNLRRMIHGKPHLIIFNKSELANEDCNRAVQRYYESNGAFALFTSARKTWKDTIEAVEKFVAHVVPSKQFQTTAYVGCVVGMPNVGKSTLINSLRMAHEYQFHKEDFHRSRTGETVSMTPGTTRGVKMIPICKDPPVVLYDSPGLTVPGCFAKEAGLKLAACGIVPTNDLSLTNALVSRYLYDVLMAAGMAEHLAECLHLARVPVSFDDCIAMICERSGRSAQSELGNLMPIQAQKFIIHDFQLGRLGKITLDRLPKKVKQQFDATHEFSLPQLTSSGSQESEPTDDTKDEDSAYEVNPEGEAAWTYHVETKESAPEFPDHLRSVLEEVHYGSGKGTSAKGGKVSTKEAKIKDATKDSQRSQFVISRKRGAISAASGNDESYRRNFKLLPGR